MNRKVLAALIICPVLFLATDKVIGITGTSTSLKEIIVNNNNDNDLSSISNSNFTNEELLSEMKASILNRKGREKEFSETEFTGRWDNEMLGTELVTFLNKKVVHTLETQNICTINLQNSFSRCPSGYDAYVITKDTKITNEGWLMANSGCDGDAIAKFRYDVANNTVEAKISDKAGFVPLDDFCKIYKAAQNDLRKEKKSQI
jgi:hypothetical protein